MSLKAWMNESPGATAIEREEKQSRAETKILDAIPFNPRTDVSADAKYIVHRLTWNIALIFIVLPIVFAVIAWVLTH